MKTQKSLLSIPALILVSTLIFSSCRKHDIINTDDDNDTSEASEQSFAENASNDITNIGSQAMDNSKARRELHWNPRPVSETVRDAVAWYARNA